MSLLLVAVGVGLLFLPGLARPLARRLVPWEWARFAGASLLAGAVALEVGLVLVGLPTLLRHLGVPALALACQRMLHGLAPGGPVVGWAALLGAVALATRAGVGAGRARRARRAVWAEPGLGAHEWRGWYEVVVVPADRPLAMAAPGAPPQVLVTTGLVATLAAPALDAVVRHEEAHLRHRHHRTLVLLAALDAALGVLVPVRRGVASLRHALERGADEEAAGTSAEGRAVVRAALLAVADVVVAEPVLAAFSGAAGVVERAEALGRPAPAGSRALRSLAWSPALGLSALGLSAATVWAGQAHMMLAMAGMCRA